MTEAKLREKLYKISLVPIRQLTGQDIDGSIGLGDSQLDAILALIAAQVAEGRDSEQNRLFAILRHLGVKHDAKAIMRVRKEWDDSRLTASSDNQGGSK